MDEAAAAAVQVAGQDIPWLLAHWAEDKPDHPVLVWDPAEGDGRSWTYAELWTDVRRLAVGLSERGIGKGDKVLIHSENCPEMVLSWLACATLGAVAVTTNTKSVAAEVDLLRREGPVRGRHHPARVRRPGRRGGAGLAGQ